MNVDFSIDFDILEVEVEVLLNISPPTTDVLSVVFFCNSITSTEYILCPFSILSFTVICAFAFLLLFKLTLQSNLLIDFISGEPFLSGAVSTKSAFLKSSVI